MAKKKNNPTAADLPTPAKPAEPAPAPLSPEELRRLHVVNNTKDSIQARIGELQGLLKGSLQKNDQLHALAGVGEAIMSVALHTLARLRALQGKTDASLATKGAYVRTQIRKALKVADQFETDLTAWNDVVETLKPAVEACTRTVKDLDLPGMKAAIGCAGEALLDDEGNPTEKAAAAATPEPAPEAPKVEPEPELAPREIQTLGMAEPQAPIIDVVPEPAPAHPLDGMSVEGADETITGMLEQMEEAGVAEGLKRKDWGGMGGFGTKWQQVMPDWDCEDLEAFKKAYDLLDFALNHRKPISWAVPTEKDLFDHQRRLAIAAGE